MTKFHYFAYGSNMLRGRLNAPERCPSARSKGGAFVDAWELAFCKRSGDGSGKANLMKTGSGRVYGVVFDIDDDEITALDKAEGGGYQRLNSFKVTMLAAGTEIETHVYLAQNPEHLDTSLIPYDWYFDLVLTGMIEHNLPHAYITEMQKIRSEQDPIEERLERQRAIPLLRSFLDLHPKLEYELRGYY